MHNMKIFAVALAILALATADESWRPKTGEEIKTIRSDCIKEHPLSDDLIVKMKQFEFPDEEPVRQYLLCTAQRMDIFCSKAGYHPDRLAKQFKMDLEEAEVMAIAESCVDKNEEGSPTDVWAFRGHKCMMASKIGEKVKAYIKKKQEEATKNASP